MDNLVAWLTRIDDSAIDTVVHVGAGAGAVLEHYAALPAARQPRQVVLVEGDPDLARSLERAAAAYPWARVRPTPVGAQGGAMPWNRFNLPKLNGLLDATALSSAYPRLRRVQTTTVRCEALADVLGSLALPSVKDDKQVHVLVLDVPGQEASLLASLSPELLGRFHVLLLRGCRSVLPPSGQTPAAALALLTPQHFKCVARESEHDTLWPVALLCFDRIDLELSELRRQVAQLSAERPAAKALEQGETIMQLETQLAEANRRLELLHLEVMKAEGQLALLKDLLLEESSL